MRRSENYIQRGWDLDNIWGIANEMSFPYLRALTEKPVLLTDSLPDAVEDERFLVNLDYILSDQVPGATNRASITFRSDRDFLSTDGSHSIEGVPRDRDVGTGWVEVTITDLCKRSVIRNYTISVQNINDIPKLVIEPIGFAYEDQAYSITFEVIDPDPDDSFIATLSSDADFLGLYGNEITGIPDNDDVGTYFVNLTVTDLNEGKDWINYTLRVIDTNDPPSIISPGRIEVLEDEPFSISLEASDPDGDPLSFDLLSDCPFLELDRIDGVLFGMPTNDDVGQWKVNITVGDGRGGNDWTEFTIIVINVNDPPELTKTGVVLEMIEDSEGIAFKVFELFMDIDGDPLIYTFETENLTVIINDGIATIVPYPDWCGTSQIIFTASDGPSSITTNVTVKVSPVNDPPKNVGIGVQGSFIVGGYQIFEATAEDADIPYGDELTFVWTSNIVGEIGRGRSINVSLPEGIHNITVKVTDSVGYSVFGYTEVTITDEEIDDKRNGLPLVLIAIPIIFLFIIGIITFLLIRKKCGEDAETPPEHTTDPLMEGMNTNS